MTEEQRQRIEQIENGDQAWRKTAYELGDVMAGHESDVDFLLSIVKGQERDSAGLEYHSAECAVDEFDQDCDCGSYDRNQARLEAATSMRSLCVEKVRAMAEQWRQEASKAGRMFSDKTALATKIAKELESLQLQEQEAIPKERS